MVEKDTGSGLVDGNDYKAEISWSGSLVYTFVPNTLGQQNSDHIIYGVPLEMYLIIPTAQYNSLQIFTFDGDESATYKHFISPVFTAEDISNSTTTKSASNEDEIGTIEKIVNGEDVAFTWTITAEEIGELINFYNNNLKLPTRQDYVNFSSILTNANFDVRAGYKGEVLLPDGI